MKESIYIFILILFSTLSLSGQESSLIKNDNMKPVDDSLKIYPYSVNYSVYYDTTWYHKYYTIKDKKFNRFISEDYVEKAKKELGPENVKDTVYYHVYKHSESYYFRSNYVKKFKEPLLYNKYQNKTIIRFIWNRAFDDPILIKIEKEKDSVTLITKIINGKLNIKSKQIDIFDFNKLDSLISKTKILYQKPEMLLSGLDGSFWIIEIHNESGYYFNNIWSPDEENAIRIIGEFIINLSGLKERIY